MPNQNNPDPNKAISTPPMGQPPIPSVFPHSDLPPLPPDFQNVTPGVPQAPSVVQPTTQPGSFSNGSASPANSLPPIISPAPKKKFGGGRVIATILGVFLLIGGITGGVILTQQNQNISEKADCEGSAAFIECRKTTGNLVCQCRECGICTRPDAADDPLTPAGALPSTGPGSTTTKVSCGTAGAVQCGTTPDGCGGFCILPVDKTCDQMLLQECNFTPVRGANYQAGFAAQTFCPSGFNSAFCNCANPAGPAPTIGVCFDRGLNSQCTGADALCAVYENSQATGGTNGANCGTVVTYYCQGVDYAAQGISCDTSTGGTTTKPANFCGTIQVDTACQGYKSTTVPCNSTDTTPTTPITPTTPGAPQCINVIAYSSTWTALTPADLSSLAVGTTINFCVAGSATDTFDMAQFKINTTLEPETTTPRPTTNDFCQSYTILPTDTTINVQAKIHAASGWVGEPI